MLAKITIKRCGQRKTNDFSGNSGSATATTATAAAANTQDGGNCQSDAATVILQLQQKLSKAHSRKFTRDN